MVMRTYTVLLVVFGTIVLTSCKENNNTQRKTTLDKDKVEYVLKEQAMGYWDLHYKFPTSYIQARDTESWYFTQYKLTDSLLLRYASEIVYMNKDTSLLITYQGDTLAKVDLPCSCDWTDEIPLGPRAYDSLYSLILDNNIRVSKNGTVEQLTFDLTNKLFPIIENKMISIGYSRLQSNENINPQYLLIEYLSGSDSIQLIKACAKYSNYFYDEYAKILRMVFSEYCAINHVYRLLAPVEVYLPASKGSNPAANH